MAAQAVTTTEVVNASVSDVVNFENIGHFELNHGSGKALIKFVCSSSEKRVGSHVYLLVVDGIIYKIGCSVTTLKNYAGYGVGNAGSPSDRTTGIHYYIAKELLAGKKVEFYVQMAPVVEVTFEGMYGDSYTITAPIDKKTHEDRCVHAFRQRHGGLPEWNKQEGGRNCDWDPIIKQINYAIREKNIIPYEDKHELSPYLRLYHWKYNAKSL